VTRRDIDKLHDEIEELFADLWQVPRFVGGRRGFRPNIDSFHTDEPHALTVVVELPGVDPARAHARYEHGVVTITLPVTEQPTPRGRVSIEVGAG
jgi:HSP20 family molecular chaperone IbpA